MIRLSWKQRLHTIFAGKLLGQDFHADEGYVTQLLELGQSEAITEFDQALNETIIHF
ncbi:hypothetical protein [Brevibacillus sp. H7]|jgi:hypothetical protein|uniref:hypothetical protein n=1 Tax=Brevibacillus sp. H7 TaxID=3349138 RepID=UPI0038264863